MVEIPTTAQVRHGYSIVDGGLNDTWLREDAEKRFDWWINGRDKRVKASTAESIITLLEAKLTTTRELFDDSDGFESHVGNRYSGMIMAYETAISLIKGEEQ